MMVGTKLLGAAALLLSACFAVPDTLGRPCVQDQDCDGGLVCEQGSCAIAGVGAGGTGATSETGEPSETGDTGDTGEGPGESETTGDEQLPEGELRLVHASPNLGPVDVYLAGEPAALVAGLAYADASAWLPVEIGTYAIELRPAGAGPATPATATGELVVAEGDRISAIAAGLLDGDPDDGLRVLAIEESWGTPLAGRARARLIHAGPDAPDLLVDGLEGPPLALDRFGATGPSGVALDVAGGERIQLYSGDVVSDDALVTAFTTPPFAEGDEVLVIATGRLGSLARLDDGFRLITVGENGLLGPIRQDPQVFTLHGARDAGNLENCTDGFEVGANFNYGEIQSAFLSPGEYDFEIFPYPAGCSGPALNPGGNASGLLEAGERYLLLLTGEQTPAPGEPALQVATFKDRFSLDGVDAANVRFVHGASAQQIFAGNVTDGEIKVEDVYTAPIAWRSESDERSLGAGFYRIGIADAVGQPNPPIAPLTPLVTFDLTAVAGVRAWGIVSGDPSPEDGDGFVQLMLVDTATPGWSVALVDVN